MDIPLVDGIGKGNPPYFFYLMLMIAVRQLEVKF